MWHQTLITISPKARGIHLITDKIQKIPELRSYKIGLAHLLRTDVKFYTTTDIEICFSLVQHTSASLALNESWDPDVRVDMEMMLNRFAPEDAPYKHTAEGPDDMPAHVKTCLVGSQLTVPITDGKLNLGTWQGIWLCEHRDHAGARKIVVTLQGTK
ncbi:UPF0047 protein YjbQ-like isoform X3 [Oscarella lobularis]|uniref:UPF0047 protein YjbQ-like isoform X3 n=1 Tax=Oscarella lobularis TaxID=121494 RepID=UPI003313F05F